MSNISLARYSPHTSSPSITVQLIECYRDVFAVEPWHEWLKCPVCEKYWGKKDAELLVSMKFQHCDTPLVDFWPRDKVVSDFCDEVTSEASCWLTLDGDKVIGLCLGYPITVADLEKKLGLQFAAQIDYQGSDIVAYQDDILVDAAYRKLGYAKKMVQIRNEDFLLRGLKHGIARTRQSPEPSVTFKWFVAMGYKIIARYPDDDGRVIQARSLAGLKELLASK